MFIFESKTESVLFFLINMKPTKATMSKDPQALFSPPPVKATKSGRQALLRRTQRQARIDL